MKAISNRLTTYSWVYSNLTPANEGRTNHSIYDPSKSPTSKKLNGQSSTLLYGDGSYVETEVYQDTVNVSGAVVKGQAIEAANNVSDSFYFDSAIDGFLGLGFDTGNRGKVLPIPDPRGRVFQNTARLLPISCNHYQHCQFELTRYPVLPTAQKTFFSNARSSLSAPLVTASLNHAAPGYFTFGYIPTSFPPSSLTYRPVLRTPNHGWWGVNVTGWSRDSTSNPQTGSKPTISKPVVTPLSLHAIVDTGSTAFCCHKRSAIPTTLESQAWLMTRS